MDYFTGDGTSTSFQLSRIPASPTSILVHIGGVKQVASTTDPAYYLDGSKLVFVSPPGAYSPIEVNYLGIAGQVNIPGVQSVTQDMLSLQLANTFVYQTTANGATASFTLNAPPVSANSLVVSANGVVQYDYSVNGSNLTFGFTPPVGTFIRVTSLALAQAGVPADGSVTSVKLGANLTITGNTTFDGFSGAGARIRGDMSNGTIANRLFFQNSSSATTWLGVIPGTSSTQSQVAVYNNPDPTNAAYLRTLITSAETRLDSNITGSGTYLPLTMYTGGSERLRIDTSGNVGIGTSSPASTFHVVGGAIVEGIDRITLRRATTPSGAGTTLSAVQFAAISTGTTYVNGSLIISSSDGAWSSTSTPTNLTFRTTPSASVTATEVMRIDSSGNVGIGVTPSAWSGFRALQVGSTTSIWSGLTGNTSSFYTNNGFFNGSNRIYLTNGLASEYIQGQGLHIWYTAASGTAGNPISFSESMRIDSSGNLILGTTAVAAAEGYRFYKNYGRYDNGTFTGFIGSGTSLGSAATTDFTFRSENALAFMSGGATERMRITSAGDIGIGTTSPKSVSNFRFVTTNATTGSGYTTYVNGTEASNFYANSLATVVQEVRALPLVFETNATERMRIDSSGNVGVGTSSPTTVTGGRGFTLYGNGTFATLSVQAFEGANNDRNATLELLSSGNGGSYSQILYGDVDTTPLTPSPLVFAGYHSGTRTERMRIDSNGNVGIGTTSPRGRLEVDPGTNSSFVVLHANRPSAGTTSSLNAQLFTISIPYSNGGAGIGGSMRVFVNASAESGLNACANRSAIFDIVISRTGANSGGGNTDVDVQIAELTNASSSIGVPVISDIGLTASNPAASASAQTVDINITGTSNGTYIWRIYATIQYMGWETITFSNLTP